MSILSRAALGASHFTVAERGLFVACEFWAAVKARTLSSHLGANALEQLQIAATTFKAIGAADFAYQLDCTLGELPYLGGDEQRRQCIAVLESCLLLTTDPVDELLARFAAVVAPTPLHRTAEPDRARLQTA